MTRIALAAAGLLLVGGAAWQFLPSAEPTSPPTAAKPPVLVPAPKPEWKANGDPIRDLDPEHARSWLVLRANNGVRTVERLRTQPEMALLPAGKTEWLDAFASVHEASFVIDLDSQLPDAERIRTYRLRQEMAAMMPAERQKRVLAMVHDKEALKMRLEQPSRSGWAAFSGWIDTTDAGSPLVMRLRSTLAGPVGAMMAVQAEGDGWAFPTPLGAAQITILGQRIALTPPATATPVPAVITALARNAAMPAAELEFALVLDPGRPGLAPVRTATGSLQIGADGPRFTSAFGSPLLAGPSLDRQCFARVPAAAILAGAVVLQPHKDSSNPFSVQQMLADVFIPLGLADDATTPPEAQAALKAASLLIEKATGVALAWLEPGMPIPSLTLEVELSKADAEAVITASGLPRSADGSASRMVGPVTVTLGWHAGHFVATTHPDGIASFGRAGGFTTHPEIQRALAAMPEGSINAGALIRPAATLDLAMPFGVMLMPELQKPLIDYRAALATGQGYGFITSAIEGSTLKIEAGGILAIVGCAMLAAQAVDPAALVRIAN